MKKQAKHASVDEYIASFPAPVRRRLEAIRKLVHDVVPEAAEKISYDMPTFYLSRDLVHFAGYAGHIGVYPLPAALRDEAGAYRSGKGSIQFPHDHPLPMDLIRKIVLHQVTARRKAK